MNDTNFKPKLIHPTEIYVEHLTTINGVTLTQREIGIISCLMNGRNIKGIANFLSVAPKTVAAHLYNATKRFGCDSDGMIALLSNSGQLLHLKEYYAALLVDNLFKKSLKEIATLVAGSNNFLNCTLVYWQKKPPFLENLKNDLTEAGLKVSLESRKTTQSFDQLIQEMYHDTHLIYFTPHILTKEQQTQEISSAAYQFPNTKFFFFPKTKELQAIPREISHFTCITPSNWHSYYFSVFAIMKRVLPNLDLDTICARFEERAIAVYSPSVGTHTPPSDTILEEGNEKKKFFLYLNKFLVIKKLGYVLAGILSVVLLFLLVPNRNYTKTAHEKQNDQAYQQNYFLIQGASSDHFAQSDLAIPADSIRLNRSKLISQIASHFQKQSQEDIQSLVLVGIGGAGKTTLARQYARSQKSPVVWEINAETRESLVTSFEALARALCQTDEEKRILRGLKDINNFTEKEEKIIHLVRAQLKAHPNWFLIYDSVDKFSDIQKYFPSDANLWGKGKIIITTQDARIQNNNYLKGVLLVGELDSGEKLSLFMNIMNCGEQGRRDLAQQKSTKELLEKIPSFPLDVSMAAYYIKATNIAYDEYTKYLMYYDQNFAAIQENILKESNNYTKTRYHIVTLSLEKLIAVNKDFADLLFLISVLDFKNIPRELLDSYKGKLVVDNFVYYLKKYSLMVGSLSNSSAPVSHISIHPSAQNIIFVYLRDLLKPKKDSSLLKETTFILDHYLDQLIEQEDFGKMQIMAGHIEKFLNHRDLLTDSSQVLLVSKLGCIYYFLNNEKSPLLIKGSLKNLIIESSKTLSSENNFRIARALLQIGATCIELGLYKEAQELLEKAANIYGKSGLNNHIELASALSHLGNVYRRLGNYEKAKDYLEESIRLSKQYGANSKRVARTLSYLGSTYRGLNSYQKSIETLEESLDLYKKLYSNDHFRVGWILTQLGYVYLKLGEYPKAKEYLENGLLIFKKYFPEDHKSMCLVLAYLGNCLRKLGDYGKSREYLEKSLKIHRNRFDENHVRMGWILFHLASTYKALGKEKESKELFDKVLEIYGNNCGEENVKTARYLRNMAEIYLEKNQLEHAQNLIQKSLKILRQHNHLETYMSLEILGDIYFKKSLQLSSTKNNQESQGFKNQAIDHFSQALKTIEHHFPKDSAHIERLHTKIKNIQEKSI